MRLGKDIAATLFWGLLSGAADEVGRAVVRAIEERRSKAAAEKGDGPEPQDGEAP